MYYLFYLEVASEPAPASLSCVPEAPGGKAAKLGPTRNCETAL